MLVCGFHFFLVEKVLRFFFADLQAILTDLIKSIKIQCTRFNKLGCPISNAGQPTVQPLSLVAFS